MTGSIKKVLLATDFSNWAQRAEEYACRLAASWHAHLTVMTVLEFPPGLNPDYPVNQQYLTDRMKEASEQLTDYGRRLAPLALQMSTRIATGLPSEEITAAARAEASDLIVLGTRGKSGLAHVLLGSTAERVIRTAPCPVLAVHGSKAREVSQATGRAPSKLLVPIDFSDCSLDALEYAALVAAQNKAAIELLHVLEPVSYGLDFTLGHSDDRRTQRERLTQRLDALSAALSAAGLTVANRLCGGVPADAILEEAQTSSSDLIVMGTHGRRGLSHVMAGSVAEAVLRRATCPVLTVRSPKYAPGYRPVVSVSTGAASGH